MRDGFLKCLDFRFGEGLHAGFVEAAAVFAPRTERQTEKGSWQLVMLLVSQIGMFGDRVLDHAPRKDFVDRRCGRQLATGPSDEEFNAKACNRVGKRGRFNRADRCFEQTHERDLLDDKTGIGQNARTRV